MNDNILKVSFGGVRTVTANPLWQYDYGQVLVIRGLNLPDLYEVHFGQSKTGNAVTVIGTEDGVDIPDSYLETAGEFYAWIYLHTGENDGETEYQIKIPVKERAKPTHETPTPVQQTEIEQLIATLENLIENYDGGGSGGGGADGVSPTVTITEITGGHRVTITDADHPSGQTFDVMDGTDGQDGNDGDDGDDGKGITSITKTSTSGLVDTYTITYTDNTTSTFTVTNGADGQDGDDASLPTASASGQVLTWNGSAWVAQAPTTELPSVTGSDEGKFLTVDSSGQWVATSMQTWSGGSY